MPCAADRRRPCLRKGPRLQALRRIVGQELAGSEERPLRAPSQEPMKIGSVDVEEFSRNLARLIEEGGQALAAYLKPREEGRKSNALAEEVGDVVKTLGQVAEYWLADPQRALEAAEPAGQGLSRSVGGGGKAPGRRGDRPGRRAGTRRQALCRSGMVVEPVLRLSQAGLSAHARAGPSSWSATPPISIRTPGRRPSSTSGRSPTRCRRRTSC